MERLIRYTPEEKMETIHLVEHSDLSVKQTLKELQVPRSTFYDWYRKYQELGVEGLKHKQAQVNQFWNRIPDPVRKQIVKLALKYSEESSRQLLPTVLSKKMPALSRNRASTGS